MGVFDSMGRVISKGMNRAIGKTTEPETSHDTTPEDEDALRAPEHKKKLAEPAVERVVERQVLVTRCKFCKQITPVDLSECENCGAAKFC